MPEACGARDSANALRLAAGERSCIFARCLMPAPPSTSIPPIGKPLSRSHLAQSASARRASMSEPSRQSHSHTSLGHSSRYRARCFSLFAVFRVGAANSRHNYFKAKATFARSTAKQFAVAAKALYLATSQLAKPLRFAIQALPFANPPHVFQAGLVLNVTTIPAQNAVEGSDLLVVSTLFAQPPSNPQLGARAQEANNIIDIPLPPKEGEGAPIPDGPQTLSLAEERGGTHMWPCGARFQRTYQSNVCGLSHPVTPTPQVTAPPRLPTTGWDRIIDLLPWWHPAGPLNFPGVCGHQLRPMLLAVTMLRARAFHLFRGLLELNTRMDVRGAWFPRFS